MRTVAIVQARMGSERLPGKALSKIGDSTVLEWVIRRSLLVGADGLIVATTDRDKDEMLEVLCFALAIPCFRGSSDDVLDRYYQCALKVEATHILRITADCPLLDPGLNSRIVDTLKTTSASYVSMSTRSNGLVQEAFTMEALHRTWEHADDPSDREHVVPWMIRNEKTLFLRPDTDLGNGRWCVDTQHDLDRLRGLYDENLDLFELSAEQLVKLNDGSRKRKPRQSLRMTGRSRSHLSENPPSVNGENTDERKKQHEATTEKTGSAGIRLL